jgi:hypothetical protein
MFCLLSNRPLGEPGLTARSFFGPDITMELPHLPPITLHSHA